MSTIFRMSVIELKRYFINKTWLFLLSLTIIAIFLIPPYNKAILKTNIITMYLFPFIMIINFSKLLANEFEFKTYKLLFTSKLPRYHIILYKLLTALEISICLLLLNQLLIWVSYIMDQQHMTYELFFSCLFKLIPVYLLYAMIIASFTFFITTISSNFAISFIITYICFNDFVKTFLNIITEKSKVMIISIVAEYLPFTIAANGFSLQHYTVYQVISLLMFAIILLISSFIIIEKRDYR